MTREDFNLTDEQINFLRNPASREVPAELVNLLNEKWPNSPEFQQANEEFLIGKLDEMLKTYNISGKE